MSLSSISKRTQERLPSYEEPLEMEDLLTQYKKKVENKFGVPYRRRLEHMFNRGSYNRRHMRRLIKPRASTI